MAKFETVPAIKMTFALLEPKADTKEEQDKLMDTLVVVKEAVEKAVSQVMPGTEVKWEMPSPCMAIIEDRGALAAPEAPKPKPVGNGAGGYL